MVEGSGPARGAADDAFAEALLADDPQELYERAPCGYLTTTPGGRILKANRTFLDWTGYSADEVVGERTLASLLTAGGRIYHETHYAPLLRLQGSVREIALDVTTSSGGRLPVLLNAVLERDADGEPALVRVAVFDATERREYERELVRAKQRAEVSEATARALAETLQQTLIPPLPPAVPGLDVAARYRPAGDGAEVGGDFYDVFQIADDDWVVALGDVCGKGVEAAVVTALVRYTVRAVAVQTSDPSEALRLVDDVLLAHGTERFCTLLILRLRRVASGGWQAIVCSGGHPLPLLLRGSHAEFVGEPGTLVGVVADVDRPETRLTLTAGDALVLYTDGVTEARRDDEFYDDHRLQSTARGHAGSAAQVVDSIVDDVLTFQGGTPRDDVAVVVVRVPAG